MVVVEVDPKSSQHPRDLHAPPTPPKPSLLFPQAVNGGPTARRLAVFVRKHIPFIKRVPHHRPLGLGLGGHVYKLVEVRFGAVEKSDGGRSLL